MMPDLLQLLHPAAVEQIYPGGRETARVWDEALEARSVNVPVPETALPAPPSSETATPPLLQPLPPQLLLAS